MKSVLRGLVIACAVYCSVGIGVAGFAIVNDDGAKGTAKASGKAPAKGGDALPFDVLDRAILWPLRIFD